jgi:hypothetical protein
MSLSEDAVLHLFEEWLGGDLYSVRHRERYGALHRKYCGSRPGVADGSAHQLAGLTAAVDGWAAGHLTDYLPYETAPPPKAVALPESRDPFTGLRRGHYAAPLSVNESGEDALRQIPGIGAASARAIVAARQAGGSFGALEELVERGCLSRESLELSRGYLTASEARVPTARLTRATADFGTYVRVRHAVQGRRDRTELHDLAIDELERAVDCLVADSYWPQHRRPRDPAAHSVGEGVARYESMSAATERLTAAVLDSGAYLQLAKRIFAAARVHIWVQAPSLSMLHVKSLRPVLEALADATQRTVDVRLLFDGNYAPGPFEADDVAYLRARGVACRPYPLAARMHSRVIVVDGEHVVCGSHSWSATSMFHSEECSVYVRSQRLARQQHERFASLWSAAAPEGRFTLGIFRLWSRSTHDKLSRAGVTDPRQIQGLREVQGMDHEELSILQREVRLVIEERIPLAIAHFLAKGGIESLGSVAAEQAAGIAEVLSSRVERREGSDHAPVAAFLGTYWRRGAVG